MVKVCLLTSKPIKIRFHFLRRLKLICYANLKHRFALHIIKWIELNFEL